uniref:ubiquitinyl hydrolase 1 n=1 Tax=Stegastes partitus TaxID=144197 RepID=A0A3B5APQ8_9TELE
MQKGLKKYFVNMDEYLSSLGLYRKMVARDASSLFRAVSEQLYFSQNYHQKIRLDCANFMRANRCNFEPFVEGSFEKYLERLEDPKETVGQVEIKALSQLYRRCFLIYRYPGKPATVISEDDFVDKVTLCCSINGHYDIVYPRSYPASAALCQSLLYELLYTQVFCVEEAELCQAMEAFRVGGRRYRNSPSVCSDVDVGYDTPEDRGQREEVEVGGAPPAEAPPPSRLSLPYKVIKSLDGEVYRNLEFDVWQDTCKEMQKTDYMVFAGRQYFLGDKCQVRLEPKGKYYNAFIQEVGTHSTAVTVFIEELGEKHLVPLTDLKPVNPVPAWNVAAPTRKGDLDSSSYTELRAELQNRFKTSRLIKPEPPVRDIRSSTRFLNRHLIGPQLTYYHPGRRYYHDYENYAFRSRRSRRQLALNKEVQFGFPAEAVEEPADLDTAITYYQLDDANDGVFPPLPVRNEDGMSARQRGWEAAGSRKTGSLWLLVLVVEGLNRCFTNSSTEEDPSNGCFLSSVAMAIPAASPWLVSELGEALCTVVAPPPYSYDPNGSDLPRDCRVLQYYFNLGVQVRHTCSTGCCHSLVCVRFSFSSGYCTVRSRSGEGKAERPSETPPHTAYLPAAPPPPHPTHLPHHSSYHACLPSSTHWGALPSGGHAPRVYCPAPSPAHVVGYITAPPTHHAATHYIPPTM